MKLWTQAENDLLASNLTDERVAEKTGRTPAAIRGKRQRMRALALKKLSSPAADAPATAESETTPTTFEQDKENVGATHWKREYDSLYGKYQTALKQASVSDQLVELAASLAPKSYDPRPLVAQSPRGAGSNQSAVLLLSDTHVGQVISPDQTLGFGGYNFATFLARLKRLENAVTSILQDHTTTDTDELVVCLGGDMIDGALNHGAEAKQKNTLFCQFYGAGHALAQFIRNLSAQVPKLRVKCVVGNHPRWQNQHKMPTDNRYSNLDAFLYAYIQALTKDLTLVEWTLDKQPFSLFDVQGFLFHLSHGDHLRGGDKALGIPNHAVGRMVSSTNQLYGKHNQASPHYYLLGHMHRGIVLPHARGSVIVNGGFPGLDGFGLMNGFSPVDPSQLLFFVHPKYGKTATYDIALKFADTDAPAPYEIPGEFDCV
ncbi:MAG: hypothetical protein HOO67_01515 [Candidatus Peribacteraceae bacterium]|nr:hypothetical protein [Candidatus Peribacteraceae bacterium]